MKNLIVLLYLHLITGLVFAQIRLPEERFMEDLDIMHSGEDPPFGKIQRLASINCKVIRQYNGSGLPEIDSLFQYDSFFVLKSVSATFPDRNRYTKRSLRNLDLSSGLNGKQLFNYEYDYDDHGNWIETRQYNDRGILIHVARRRIVYFPH